MAKRTQPHRRDTPDDARPPILGIDVGGVLVRSVADNVDTSFFGARPMETPTVEGCIDAVAHLTTGYFAHQVHIVSKAGPKISELTREWLGHTGFFAATQISQGNLHFVRKRIDKAPICKRLGVTHFIDDRPDVLAHLTTVTYRFLFRGGRGDEFVVVPEDPSLIIVDSWHDVLQWFTGRDE